jgi:hypothetical protein
MKRVLLTIALLCASAPACDDDTKTPTNKPTDAATDRPADTTADVTADMTGQSETAPPADTGDAPGSDASTALDALPRDGATDGGDAAGDVATEAGGG